MKYVETLTMNETLNVFRAYGVPMSYDKLRTLIDGGALPWAVSARRQGAGGFERVIFAKPLVAWLDAMSEEATA